MARPATGSVIEPTAKQPCFGLRFRADGKRRYITLGRPEDGWTRVRAERELAVVLRDVELGTWQPPQPDPTPQPPEEDVRFLEFSADWLDAKVLEIEENTASSYRNDLRNHLIPFFKDHLVKAIDVKQIDRYRQHKVAENAVCQAAIDAGRPLMVEILDKRGRRYQRVRKPLSARSINMQIDLLQQILELAGVVVDPAARLAGEPCDLVRVEQRRRRSDGAQAGCEPVGEAVGESVEQPIVFDELAGERELSALLAALVLGAPVWTTARRARRQDVRCLWHPIRSWWEDRTCLCGRAAASTTGAPAIALAAERPKR